MDEKRIAPDFLKNNLYRFVHMVLSHLGGIIFTIFIARILGPKEFGTYVLAMSFALILISLGELGINEATVRYISLYQKNIKKAKSYFVYLLKLKIVILLILSLTLISTSKLLAYFYNDSTLVFPIIIAGLYIFFYSLMQILTNLFFALQNMKAVIYKEVVFQILRIILIPLVLTFSVFFIVSGPIILSILSSLGGLLFSIIYLYKNYPYFLKSNLVKIDKKELFRFMKYLSVSSLSLLVLLYTDVLILGKFVDLEFLGFYKTASSIVLMAASFLTLTIVLYPILTRLDKEKIKKIFDILLYYLLIISIPLTLGTIFMGKAIISLLFGYEYLPAVIPLYGLALLIFILPLEEMFRTLINSRGESKLTAKTMTIASILNIVLNLAFAYGFLIIFKQQIYAALGVSIATILSRAFVLISLLIISKKKFDTTLIPIFIIKPLISGAVMTLFLIYFNNLFAGSANLFSIILEIILAALIYFIVLYLIKGVSKKEFNYIFDLFKENFNYSDKKSN
ncbi:MAG: oligosaccharide flippase family protein [Candidatus Pacearchaeota archaeon]|jgi:O-antigen/teichoic acid export membrane protein